MRIIVKMLEGVDVPFDMLNICIICLLFYYFQHNDYKRSNTYISKIDYFSVDVLVKKYCSLWPVSLQQKANFCKEFLQKNRIVFV